MNLIEQIKINNLAKKMAADTVADYMIKISTAIELTLREEYGIGEKRLYRFIHSVNKKMPEPYTFQKLPEVDYIPRATQMNLAEMLLSFGCENCKEKNFKNCKNYKGYKYLDIPHFSEEGCPYSVTKGQHNFTKEQIEVLKSIIRKVK